MGIQHTSEFTSKLHQISKKYYVIAEERWNKEDVGETLYTFHSHADGSIVGRFQARVMPGCCGILLVYYLRANGKKAVDRFSELFTLIQKAASAAKFGATLYTQVVDSQGYSILLKIEANTLEGENADFFTNHKTGNEIKVFLFPTNYKAPVKGPIFEEE